MLTKYIFPLSITLLSLFATSTILSAQQLDNIVYSSDNTLILNFDNPEAADPGFFSSSLSEDKTSLQLDLQTVEFDSKLKNESRSGRINGVYFTNKDSHLVIDIKFNDSYGYTCVPQPMSGSIVISIFKWNEIDKAEDSYRSAQLAMESGIKGEIVSNLVDGIDHGSKKSELLLAYINSTDSPDHSLSVYKEIGSEKTELPDVVYNASELLFRSGDNDIAEQWLERFEFLTGLSVDKNSDPATLIESLLGGNDDGSLADETAEVEAITSMNGSSKKWEDLFMMVAIGLLGISLVTISLILVHRKKRKKIAELEKSLSSKYSDDNADYDFDAELETAKKNRVMDIDLESPSQLIAAIAERKKSKLKAASSRGEEVASYSATGSIGLDSILDNPAMPSNDTQSDLKHEANFATDNTNVHLEEDKKSDIESFLSTFIPKQRELENAASNDLESTIRSVVKEVEYDNLSTEPNHQTAEMELAFKIAQKENNNKFSKLRKLDLSKLEGSSRINELSKQLSIDTTALSAKKRVADLNNNKTRISKLSKRFDVS